MSHHSIELKNFLPPPFVRKIAQQLHTAFRGPPKAGRSLAAFHRMNLAVLALANVLEVVDFRRHDALNQNYQFRGKSLVAGPSQASDVGSIPIARSKNPDDSIAYTPGSY